MRISFSLTMFRNQLPLNLNPGVSSSNPRSAARPQDGHAQVRKFPLITKTAWDLIQEMISSCISTMLPKKDLSVFVLPPRNFPVFVRKVLPDSNKKTQKVKSFTHSLNTETSSFDLCDNAIMIIFQNSVQEMKISLQQLSNPNFSRGGSRPNSSPTPAVNGIGKTFFIFIQEKLES